MPRYLVKPTFSNGLAVPMNEEGRQAMAAGVKNNAEQGVSRVHNKARRLLSAAALAFGALGLQGSAMALTTEHGAICKPYGDSGTSGLYTSIQGVINYAAGTMGVACPVVRTTNPTLGTSFSVWVDGNAGSGTMNCSLYSYNYSGVYLGGVSFVAAGTFTRTLSLPAAQVPNYSSQVVYCNVPRGGALFDIEPVQ